MKIGPKYKLARRLGAPIFEKTQSPKYALSLARKEKNARRGRNKPKSEFGLQLIEKQKLKLLYGIRERQFQNYFAKASRQKGLTTEILLQLLETRLDNIVYRLGLAPTRAQARQLVTHGHFKVNGRRINVPSYSAKVGDKISIREGSAAKKVFGDLPTTLKKYEPAEWLSLEKETITGHVVSLPTAKVVSDVPVEVGQIVEFYSR